MKSFCVKPRLLTCCLAKGGSIKQHHKAIRCAAAFLPRVLMCAVSTGILEFRVLSGTLIQVIPCEDIREVNSLHKRCRIKAVIVLLRGCITSMCWFDQ